MKLVATVSSNKEIELAEKANVIEIRLDLFEEEIKFPKKEVIITCRRKIDGGRYEGNDAERIELMKRFKADYVDLECDLPDSFFDFNCKIIESYHNFKETPDYEFLRDLVKNRRGEYFKIATLGRSKSDVEKIVKILCKYDNVIAFLMGSDFTYTRILSAFLGSPFIYCYVGRAKAPGQLELNRAYEILKLMGVKL